MGVGHRVGVSMAGGIAVGVTGVLVGVTTVAVGVLVGSAVGTTPVDGRVADGAVGGTPVAGSVEGGAKVADGRGVLVGIGVRVGTFGTCNLCPVMIKSDVRQFALFNSATLVPKARLMLESVSPRRTI